MTDKEKQAVISSLKTMKKHEKIGACATCAKAAGFALELIDEYERASRYKLQYEASIVDNGRASDPLEKRIYGSYVSLPIDPEESKEEKIRTLQRGMEMPMQQMKEADVCPDFNTISFKVQEGPQSKNKTWYEGEEGEPKQEAPYYAILIAVRYREK